MKTKSDRSLETKNSFFFKVPNVLLVMNGNFEMLKMIIISLDDNIPVLIIRVRVKFLNIFFRSTGLYEKIQAIWLKALVSKQDHRIFTDKHKKTVSNFIVINLLP